MKSLLAGIGLICVASAHAVFDLQQVSRFSSSAIAPTAFRKIVPTTGGGFVVAGTVAEDALLVEFDASGSVIRTGIWDSPLVGRESIVALHRYNDGKLLLHTTEGSRTFLVQFSPGFTPNWEVERSGTGTISTIDGSGSAFLFQGTSLETFSVAGASKGTLSLPNFQPNAADGRPGAVADGAVVVGRDTSLNRPCAVRVSSTPAQLYRTADVTGASSTASNYFAVHMESTGTALVAGFATSSFSTIFTNASTGGVLTSFLLSGLTGPAEHVEPRGATEAIVSGFNLGAHRINRTTGAVLVSGPAGGTDAYATLSGPGQGVAFLPNGNVQAFSLADGSTIGNRSLGQRYESAAALSSTAVAAVAGDTPDSTGRLVMDNGLNSIRQSFQLAGGPRRVASQSVTFPDNSVAMSAVEVLGSGDRPLVVRYRPDGTLLYARGVSFSSPYARDDTPLTRFSDSSVAIAGSGDFSGVWFFARLSPSGVTTVNKTFADFEGFRPRQILGLNDGSSAVLGLDNEDQFKFVLVSSTGTILDQTTYDLGQSTNQIAPPLVNSNGSLLVANKFGNVIRTRIINPANGSSLATVDLGTNVGQHATTLDGAGNFVIAYNDGGSLRAERLSGQNLGSLNSRTVGALQECVDVAVAPNGNTLVLYRTSGDDELKILGPGGFADVATAVLVPTVNDPISVTVDASNVAYLTAIETVGGIQNVYSARYLATGVRSAQRRTAGTPTNIHVAGTGVWVVGEVGTRKKGRGPFAARYSL